MAAAITATDRYTFFTERVISLPPMGGVVLRKSVMMMINSFKMTRGPAMPVKLQFFQ
jgi:hypothetical protein